MTTIAVVRKNGYAAIAADTMTKWGTGKETAEYIINHSKILKVGTSYIGVTGSATFKTILQDYFGRSRAYARFDTPFEIFRTWQRLHAALKQEYYLITGHSEEDVLESTRMDALIVNARGIFGVAAHRTVQEFSMHSTYAEPSRSAENVARTAIEAAAEFDDSTGAPVTSFTVKLTRK
jgi:ATP-dependent protease HslVU (ClpYQ) peptidase subunit